MPVNVMIRLTFPPDQTPESIALINSMLGHVSVEPGCIHCGLYSSINDDDSLLLVEEWQSHELFQQHVKSNDFRKILEFMELAAEPPEIKVFNVSNTAGIELVKVLRGI